MNKILCVLLILWNGAAVFSQSSGPQYYRSSIMDKNNIKTVFGNWGVIGQPIDSRPRGAWMRSSNGYIGDECFFVGVEFPVKDYNNDGSPDSIHSVITCQVDRPSSSRDESPIGEPWTFMPTSSSVNSISQSVPMSNDPSSWPPEWGGMWYGLNGMGSIRGDVEAYFRVDDQNDKRFNVAQNNPAGYIYHPDSTNISMTGQGIRVDVRYLQYNHPLLNDILFRVYDITNVSTNQYDRVVFGYLMGTYVGVTGNQPSGQEYDDDFTVLYKSRGIAITGDYNNSCARNLFWNGPVGKFGNAILGSDGNRISSFFSFGSSQIALGDDEVLWQQLRPGNYYLGPEILNDTIVMYGADKDYTAGTEYFPLNSGQSKRITSVLVYGYTNAEILQKLLFAQVLLNNDFDKAKIGTKISLKNLTEYTTLSSNHEIQWQSTQTGGTVDILFSNDGGSSLTTVASNIPNTGTFQWNTAGVQDCYFGKIDIILKDSSGKPVDIAESAIITINNIGNGSPSIIIDESSSPFNNGASISEQSREVTALIGDPESESLVFAVYFNAGGGFVRHTTETVQSNINSQNITIQLSSMPNSNNMTLRFDVTDGTDTVSYTTGKFSKQNPRVLLAPSKVSFIAKNTNSAIDVMVADYSKLTNDSYIVSFNDTDAIVPRKFSVFNTSKNKYAVDNAPLPYKTESQIFDGLTLLSNDEGSSVMEVRWNRMELQSMNVAMLKNNLDVNGDGITDMFGYRHAVDYKVIFYNNVVDTVSSVWAPYGIPQAPLKYKIFNSRNEQAQVAFDDDLPGLHYIYLYENILGTWRYTWNMWIAGDIVPSAGDTLYLLMYKGLSIYDSLLISSPLFVADADRSAPEAFQLTQNYPNPFNPTTTIRYALPFSAKIKLSVYDLLGREIATLVSEEQSAGRQEVIWNAEGCASGIYLYKLTAGNFIEIKKMLVVK